MEISKLLLELNRAKASDLLLVAGNPPCLRVNDKLVRQGEGLLTSEAIEALVAPLLRKGDMEKFKQEKELDIGYGDSNSRYRVNLHFQSGSMAAAIRRISNDIPSLEELGVPPIAKNFTMLKRGLVLVTGPTGSGKSTTQAAMIHLINQARACHIITIEDPIEYMHKPKQAVIEQREVGFDTLSFAEALKRVLRQIPDVILVGEMRDLESIQMAITAAETGHLVISTLHTQDAVQTIDRLIDVFPPHQQAQVRTQLSLTLMGILAQQLIERKDGNGLALATEVMVINSAIRNIIRKGATQEIYSMLEIGKQEGMQHMDACLADMVKQGKISHEEALFHAINRERFEKLL